MTIKISAEENFRLRFGIGDIGLGLNYSPDDYLLYEVNASLITFAIEHKNTNIGLALSPINYFYLSRNNDMNEGDEKLSFINLKMYWNILSKGELVLGPFFSLHYLFNSNWNNMNYSDAIYNIGISFEYSSNFKNNLYYKLIGCEIGYKNIFGENCLYFNINVDVIIAMYGIASTYSITGNNIRK
jgi:hypothetical protein